MAVRPRKTPLVSAASAETSPAALSRVKKLLQTSQSVPRTGLSGGGTPSVRAGCDTLRELRECGLGGGDEGPELGFVFAAGGRLDAGTDVDAPWADGDDGV